VWAELEDLRNIYAHHFGGLADASYLGHSKRRVLKAPTRYTFKSGAIFDGSRVNLGTDHLLYYVERGKAILRVLS